MKKHPESELLMEAVLEEVAPAEFRAALLGRTLRHARRRRHQRIVQRSVLAVGALAIIGGLWKGFSPEPRLEGKASNEPIRPEAFRLVRTQPSNPGMIVRTERGLVAIVPSTKTSWMVETQAREDLFREVDDEQLLRFFAGRPAALARLGPGRAELLLPQAAEENRSPGP